MKIAFVDESQIYLDREKCLLYGVYICNDLMFPSKAISDIRKKYDLKREIEIKWTINTGDQKLNSKIKEDLIWQTHEGNDQFLISITRGNNKKIAFETCLKQIRNHFSISKEDVYGVIFDNDITPNKKDAKAYIKSMGDQPSCQIFAEADSELTAGISVVDGFLGAYAYMVHKQDKEKQPQIETHPEFFLRLDDFFWEAYRRSIPGEFRWDENHHEDEDIAIAETGYNHTLGHGLFIDPKLTEEQHKRLEPFINLYLGCTI